GIGQDVTIFDEPYEKGYWYFSLYGEVGTRIFDGWSVGALYQVDPIFSADNGGDLNTTTATRSGKQQFVGATTTFGTPNHRRSATATAFYPAADYTFDLFNERDLPQRGFGGSLRLVYNATLATSIQVRGTIRSDDWNDMRPGDAVQATGHYVPTPHKRVTG